MLIIRTSRARVVKPTPPSFSLYGFHIFRKTFNVKHWQRGSVGRYSLWIVIVNKEVQQARVAGFCGHINGWRLEDAVWPPLHYRTYCSDVWSCFKWGEQLAGPPPLAPGHHHVMCLTVPRLAAPHTRHARHNTSVFLRLHWSRLTTTAAMAAVFTRLARLSHAIDDRDTTSRPWHNPLTAGRACGALHDPEMVV